MFRVGWKKSVRWLVIHFGGAPGRRSRGAITAVLALLIHGARLAAFPGEVEACCLFGLPERFVKSCHVEDHQLFFVFYSFCLTLISLTRWNVSHINFDLFLIYIRELLKNIWKVESPLKMSFLKETG